MESKTFEVLKKGFLLNIPISESFYTRLKIALTTFIKSNNITNLEEFKESMTNHGICKDINQEIVTILTCVILQIENTAKENNLVDTLSYEEALELIKGN